MFNCLFCCQKFETVPVSAKTFVSRVLNPESSYRDVIRVFLKHSDWLSDDDVDDLIVAQISLHEVHDTMAVKSRWSEAPDVTWKITDESENRLVGKYITERKRPFAVSTVFSVGTCYKSVKARAEVET